MGWPDELFQFHVKQNGEDAENDTLRHNISTYGPRAFAVAGPAAWNSLSDDLRDPALTTDSFRRLLTIRLFYRAMHFSANARSWDRMSSVRPSVTLVICDHIGWKSWKLIARTISQTLSLFVAKR